MSLCDSGYAKRIGELVERKTATYPAQDSIASANAAVARDIVSSADWKFEHEFKS